MELLIRVGSPNPVLRCETRPISGHFCDFQSSSASPKTATKILRFKGNYDQNTIRLHTLLTVIILDPFLTFVTFCLVKIIGMNLASILTLNFCKPIYYSQSQRPILLVISCFANRAVLQWSPGNPIFCNNYYVYGFYIVTDPGIQSRAHEDGSGRLFGLSEMHFTKLLVFAITIHRLDHFR